MKYKDLNLKKLRDDNGLDFAHFTYKKGMCSCCYGPKDLPKSYWKNGIIPDGDDYEYILFKNAYNGGGVVKRDDVIKDYQCIGWSFPIEKLEKVCRDLQAQLGSQYVVLKPERDMWCIIICKLGSHYIEDELKNGNYSTVQND